ncbi:hypothetical protein D187_004163 [Cystobacter fuscus DSM 2262]|uniref:Uncharacterized protein n=1 Tax=Cystobacter fuscus (strain ATCC 25194 / DSM 2262 / NBRC 100088 / M29) TaxID=1242864 RepID=S9P840_CYSF2|nr:hypothetical protein D187_004163 [Cystobacter fuscus DSM 2262]
MQGLLVRAPPGGGPRQARGRRRSLPGAGRTPRQGQQAQEAQQEGSGHGAHPPSSHREKSQVDCSANETRGHRSNAWNSWGFPGPTSRSR